MTDYREVFEDCAEGLSIELDNCADLIATIRSGMDMAEQGKGCPIDAAHACIEWFKVNPGVAERIAMAVIISSIARSEQESQ